MRKSIYIALTLLVAAAILFFSSREKQEKNNASDIIQVEPSDPLCDLQKGACSAQVKGLGNLVFEILPREILMNKPFKMTLKVAKDIDAKVWVDFMGLNMNMGYNRPVMKKDGPNHYVTEATLPACTVDSMTWQATVLIRLKNKTYGIPFKFITEKE